MSQENVEVVKALFTAWADRDSEAALSRIDPNVEVDLASSVWGNIGVGRGHEALGRAVTGFLEAWEAMEFFPENFIDAGGSDVIVWLRIIARGKARGVPTERHGASVYTVRNGLVIRWRAFETLSEAVNAVGI
jgi:ketosteroid isomerase-like protein